MNITVFRLINNLGVQFPWLDSISIFLASYALYLLPIFLIIYWFSRKRNDRVMVICAVLAAIFARFIGRIAGLFHQNLQPFAELQNVHQLIQHNIDNSFPSDHTMVFFAVCMTFYLFKKRLRYAWLILALCVGVSRILVGVHYPLDVLVGAVLGLLSAYILFKIVPKLKITHTLIDFYEKFECKIWPKKTN